MWYAGEQLESIAPPQVLSEATISEGSVVPGSWGEGTLRSDSFVGVEVAYELQAGLTVRHAGHTYVHRRPIHGWAPRRGWRFGLGARTGMGSDDHHVDELLIEAGSAYRAEPVGVELTLNGLQFSEGGLLYEYQAEPVAAEVEAAPSPATE